MQTKNLFEEFAPVSTEKWHLAIEKFLKGKSIKSLDWELEKELVVSPLHRAEDTQAWGLATAKQKENNSWALCEKINVKDCKIANQSALAALQKGANALCFVLHQKISTADLNVLLDNILLDLVHLHFEGEGARDEFFIKNLTQVKNNHLLQGSVSNNRAVGNVSLVEQIKESSFASFQYITIQIADNKTASLAQALHKASLWIDTLLGAGVSKEKAVTSFRFEFETHEHYFVEIAKFRAFDRLWLGLLEAYELKTVHFPYTHANTTLSIQKENQYWNMITATTQAMAAAIAGVSSLAVCPSTGLEEADDFAKRIARNVQHLLASESYMDRVLDPAAGSYYIENLTEQLVVKAWQQFCQL